MQARWPEHVILRSSIIYGPQCPTPVSRLLFLQVLPALLGSFLKGLEVWLPTVMLSTALQLYSASRALHLGVLESGNGFGTLRVLDSLA